MASSPSVIVATVLTMVTIVATVVTMVMIVATVNTMVNNTWSITPLSITHDLEPLSSHI